jgi:hypothetical protein
MGWWTSEDGAGVIGDRPVDILGGVLTSSLGERFSAELLAGFLVALAAALARTPDELLDGSFDPDEVAFVVEYAGRPTAVVALVPPAMPTSLDDAVYAALARVAAEYRVSALDRNPSLPELLETVAFAARGHVLTEDRASPLALTRIGVLHDESPPAGNGREVMRALLDLRPPLGRTAVALVAHALDDHDWQVRLTAALVAGRFGLAELADRVAVVEVPPSGSGVTDHDRRTLLALRDVAAARSAGHVLERPVHPDPDVAERRREFLAALDAAVTGAAEGASSEPVETMRRLLGI